MSTNVVSVKDIKRDWYLIDASGKVLGRLATEIATKLMGKNHGSSNKAQFVPYLDTGDYVVITNASKITVTGKKMQNKTYTRHSGFPGGLRVENFEKMIAKKPEFIIQHAVAGMLPKGKLGRAMIKKLKVFAGSEHPFKKLTGEQI